MGGVDQVGDPARRSIVTSPFHMARAFAVFQLVPGSRWPLEAFRRAPCSTEAEQAKVQTPYLAHTLEQFSGIEPGDISRMAARIRATMHEHVSDEAAAPASWRHRTPRWLGMSNPRRRCSR